MKQSLQHPLDNIYPNNSLFLLEAMIPYLDPSFQLPIALLIKLQELRTLILFFHSPSQMASCGFDRSNCGNEELLSVLCQTMGVQLPEQIASMQNMMNLASMMSPPPVPSQPFQPPAGSDIIPESLRQEDVPSEAADSMSESREDLISAIRQILSEQEGNAYESESAT